MSEQSKFPIFLSSKVAFSVANKKKLPFPKREFPRLSNMCILMLSQHFDKFPTLEGIERHFKEQVYDHMGLNFKMATLAKHVEYEPFWKKACLLRWKIQHLPKDYDTWRSAFFSKYLQEKIENMEDLDEEYSDLIDLLKVMASSTFRLRLDQIKVDFDMADLLGKLTCLKYLRLAWVKKVISGPFSTQQLGMSLNDANNLGNLMASLKELETLELACNKIDDDGVKIIMKSLEDHPTLKFVSFSHNKLGNVGARRAARIFNKNKHILGMDLSNNQIGYEGARCLSMVMSDPVCQLEHLNLSLNLISDKAVAIMLSDIAGTVRLKHLDLSSNLLTDECVPHFRQFLMTNKSLTTLKLNCNKFTFESYKPFKECLDKNATLSVFELNNCDMDQSREIELSEIITRKAIERKGQTFVSTPAIEKYMLDQRKALHVHEGSDEIVEEPQPAEGTKPPEKVAVNVADGEDKEKPDELKGSED